jgi:rRNA maturation protein Nop10
MRPDDDEPGEGARLKDVVCPQCGEPFRLVWSAGFGEAETLEIRSCPSGGIYDVRISCPHCDYEEDL